MQDLFPALVQDRALFLPLGGQSSKDRPLALAYAACGLVLLLACAAFSATALHSRSIVARVNELAAGRDEGQLSLARQAAILHFLQEADRQWWLPNLGLNAVPTLLARAGDDFVHAMQDPIARVLAECQALAGARGFSYTALQRLLWLHDATNEALAGKTTGRPFPVEAQPGTAADKAAGGQSSAIPPASGLWTPEFGQLFLTYAGIAPKGLLQSLANRIDATSTATLGRDDGQIFEHVVTLVNARVPQDEFPLSRFWPSAPRGSRGFASIPPAYTARGFAAIRNDMEQLAADNGVPFREQPYWKAYLARYADVWADFARQVDSAWLVVDRVDALQRMSEGGPAPIPRLASLSGPGQGDIARALGDPYFRLILAMGDELAPLKEEQAAPPWVDQLLLVRALLQTAAMQGDETEQGLPGVLWNAGRLDRADIDVLRRQAADSGSLTALIRGSNALARYLGALAELRGTLASPEGSLTLASILYGGKDYGDPETTALTRAKRALEDFGRALAADSGRPAGGRQARTTPGLHLVAGPLRFLEQAIVYHAATTLQHIWESEVLPQATLLPVDGGLEPLFGEKGLVTRFATTVAKPFLSRRIGAYVAVSKDNIPFPFAGDFLTFLQEGQAAQANPLRESYAIRLHASSPSLNPDAAERMQYYELRLDCASGPQTLRNSNYPSEATFLYEPKTCTSARLEMHFPSLRLTYDYENFRNFLQEFSMGERIFTQADFPAEGTRMETLRLRTITLRLLADEANSVLTAFSGELLLPPRVTTVW